MLKPEIRRIWSSFEAIPGTSREKLGVLLHESKVIFVEKSKLQFQGYKRKEKMLRATLTSLHRLQERDPNCDWIESLLAIARNDLKLNELSFCTIIQPQGGLLLEIKLQKSFLIV